MLLVEDDQVSAGALSTILRRRGFDVTHVLTIAEAMPQLNNPPSFIILDLMLPDGDGITVLRAVRERGLASRVMVLTAVSDPDRLRQVSDLSPEAVLQKPINLPRLLALMLPLH